MTYALVIFYTLGGVATVPTPSLEACNVAREALLSGFASTPGHNGWGHVVAICTPTEGKP